MVKLRLRLKAVENYSTKRKVLIGANQLPSLYYYRLVYLFSRPRIARLSGVSQGAFSSISSSSLHCLVFFSTELISIHWFHHLSRGYQSFEILTWRVAALCPVHKPSFRYWLVCSAIEKEFAIEILPEIVIDTIKWHERDSIQGSEVPTAGRAWPA